MTKRSTRMKQLMAEQAAAIRIHDGMSTLLLKQLRRAPQALVTADDVLAITQPLDKMVVLSRMLCDEVGLTESSEATLNAVLGSPDGEARGREYWQLSQDLQLLFDGCAERSLILLDEALSDQALVHQYSALCRQAEAITQTLSAMQRLCHVQFHVIKDRFGFACQVKGG